MMIGGFLGKCFLFIWRVCNLSNVSNNIQKHEMFIIVLIVAS